MNNFDLNNFKQNLKSSDMQTELYLLNKELELLKKERLELLDSNKKQSEKILRDREKEKKRILSQKNKKAVAAHLLNIQEKERSEIAREMQENLGQLLAALKLNVSVIGMEYRDHNSLVDRIEVMEKMLIKSITIVQRISSELRPVMLDILGLADAMEWQAQVFQKMSGIHCKTNINLPNKKVDLNTSSAIFRVFKEALNNVTNHVGATVVHVELVERKSWLTLSVHDDGRSNGEKLPDEKLSLSVALMMKRVEALGGKLRINENSRYGVALLVRIPLSRKENRHANEDTYSG